MFKVYLNKTEKTAPLAVFRVFFGLLMFVSIVRFWSYGWINEFYIQPKFFFSYYGFEFVKPLGNWTYLLFVICAISSLLVCIGYQYRISIIALFLSFTYIELMDKTTYLNHYYFISLLSFLLIFLPLNRQFSLDAFLKPKQYLRSQVPRWTIDSIKLLIAIVYVYAALAKLNSDWLFEAQPLKIWLTNKYDFPVIGKYFHLSWVHYFFSWFGMLYDLTIPFLLLYKPTRKLAFLFVIGFHIMTWLLFPIGMFPFIMITSALIFFDSKLHLIFIKRISSIFKLKSISEVDIKAYQFSGLSHKLITGLLVVFFVFQLLLPWRYLCYPGELFWTEEGYRYSWRVMLIEKAGYTVFTIKDPKSGKAFEVQNNDFLNAFQIKQMSTQPDFIVQYAHMLRDHFKSQWIETPEVYVKSRVTLNGRLSQPFIDPKINLANEKDSFAHKTWILPFNDEIKGL